MTHENKTWSPKCTKYISVSHMQDVDCDVDEIHIEFQTEKGDKFVLNLSSSEAHKLSEGILVMLQQGNLPTGVDANNTR